MFTRRSVLGTTTAVAATAVAGCSRAPFVDSDPLEFRASRATVPASARENPGYEERVVSESTRQQTVQVGDQSRDIVVTNWRAEYDRAVDLSRVPVDGDGPRAAVFVAFSTPQVSVLGRTFNPVGDIEAPDLAGTVQGRYEGLDGTEQVGEGEVVVAGQETTAGEFRAEAALAETGTTVEIALHVTEAVAVNDDFVVTVSSYPRQLQTVEREPAFAMMAAVDHEG